MERITEASSAAERAEQFVNTWTSGKTRRGGVREHVNPVGKNWGKKGATLAG